jgi:hypothetical protein
MRRPNRSDPSTVPFFRLGLDLIELNKGTAGVPMTALPVSPFGGLIVVVGFRLIDTLGQPRQIAQSGFARSRESSIPIKPNDIECP